MAGLSPNLAKLLYEETFGQLLIHECVCAIVHNAMVAVCKVGNLELVRRNPTTNKNIYKSFGVLPEY